MTEDNLNLVYVQLVNIQSHVGVVRDEKFSIPKADWAIIGCNNVGEGFLTVDLDGSVKLWKERPTIIPSIHPWQVVAWSSNHIGNTFNSLQVHYIGYVCENWFDQIYVVKDVITGYGGMNSICDQTFLVAMSRGW